MIEELIKLPNIINNKWLSHYIKLMNKSKIRAKTKNDAKKLVGYVEAHHIIPKSFGGNNSNKNIAYLSAREHFIAHRLLVKFCTSTFKAKMIFALHKLLYSKTIHQDGRKIIIENSKKYANVKKLIVENHIKHKTGSKHSEETKLKMSKAQKGRIITPVTIEKIRQAHSGKILSEEHKAKIRQTCNTDEFKQKSSQKFKDLFINEEYRLNHSIKQKERFKDPKQSEILAKNRIIIQQKQTENRPKIKCIFPNKEIIIFKNLDELALYFNRKIRNTYHLLNKYNGKPIKSGFFKGYIFSTDIT